MVWEVRPLVVLAAIEDEWMCCAACGRREKFDALRWADWTVMQVRGKNYALCPGERPAAPATTEVIDEAAERCFRVINARMGVYN